MSTSIATVNDCQHMRPCLPDSIKPLVTSKMVPTYSEQYGYDEVEGPWEAPEVSGGALECCRQHLRELQVYLEPAPAPKLIARVAGLMAHFYVNDSRPELQRAVAHDWSDALGEFPWWAIAAACQKWVRMERRRPTPADIRDLCQRAVKEDARTKRRLEEIVRKNSGGVQRDNIASFRRMPA